PGQVFLLAQRQFDVVAHPHPGEEAAAVLLEHHRRPGRRPGDALPPQQDLAGGGCEQAGDALQQGRLAAPGRADDADQFTGVQGEGEVAHRLDVPAVSLVDLPQRPHVEHVPSFRGWARPVAAGPVAGHDALLERRRPWYQARARRSTTRNARARSTPSSPSSRMPLHISGMAKPRWNWTTAKPRPLLAANISLMTIRMTPIDSACRSPAKICGDADGRTRWRRRAGPARP